MILTNWPSLLIFCYLLLLSGCAPIEQPSLRFGAHTITATEFSQPSQIDGVLQLAQQAHFDTLVHVFAWREIEPTRDQFHWQQADTLVAAAEYYGFDLIPRLDQHPAWASEVEMSLNAPPHDLADYRRFVERVVSRYQGRIGAYIIWNEPNLAIEWGGQPPDPVAFTELLRVGYEAVKTADPQALVVAAGLAPTNSNDATGLDERVFLRAMYEAGAAAYFDVLAAHPYSFGLAPTAPQSDSDHPAFGRLADVRALMVEYGDAAKPIWITEMGWTIDPPPYQADIVVTPTQQAEYLVEAVALIEQDWPWVELVTVWNLARLPEASPFAGYSLIDSTGEPRPVYEAWQTMMQARQQPLTRLGEIESPDAVQILAEDSIVHLGDTDLQPPWWPLYRGIKPSLTWTGGFYLSEVGGEPWHLSLELMQQNEIGATVAVNGVTLSPDLPQQDFTRRWLTVRRPVPAELLRRGHNTLTLTTVRLLPDAQQDEFVWDDFQMRNIKLSKGD